MLQSRIERAGRMSSSSWSDRGAKSRAFSPPRDRPPHLRRRQGRPWPVAEGVRRLLRRPGFGRARNPPGQQAV